MPSSARKLRARAAAHARWATEPDRAAATAPARAAAQTALDRRLIARLGLDPNGPDFERRLRSARRYYFSALAAKRVKAGEAAS